MRCTDAASFELLPDEIILHICRYLRGADILYSFYNLNNRLNQTITEYRYHVNLMSVSHLQFEYCVSKILLQTGSTIRTFILNGNWETIISKTLFSILFELSLSELCPNIEKLILKWFTSERLLWFVTHLQNCSYLTELQILYLRGTPAKDLLPKVLSSNGERLKTVIFDQDSSDFSMDDLSETISHPNIEKLSINISSSDFILHIFTAVPNVSSLSLTIGELSDSQSSKKLLESLNALPNLTDFSLRSINLFWKFDEISQILNTMPSLERLVLDIRTDDSRLILDENLARIIPKTIMHLNFFIRVYDLQYHEKRQLSEKEISSSHNREKFTISLNETFSCPLVYLPDEQRHRTIIHTIPCDIRSLILPVAVVKHLSPGWKYYESIEDLCIYDAESFVEVLMILQHFRNIRSFTIDTQEKAKPLNYSPINPAIPLSLRRLKQIDFSGISPLLPLLKAAPNFDYLIISFDCLDLLLKDQQTCSILERTVTRLNVSHWTDLKSDLLKEINKVFCLLRHLVITMKDPTANIDDFVLSILAYWKGKQKLSFDVKGSVSQVVKQNTRRWLIDYSHLTQEDSFATECKDDWFDLWY